MTLNRARILVVDDQRDVAVTLTSGLREAGAVLSYATDGEAALRLVQAGGFDVVLLDMKMPPGDWGGLWVLTQLRERGLSVPVIVMSGEGGQKQTIEALRLGARDWVDKGAANSELVTRSTELLDAARVGALTSAARTLPSLVAHDLERYAKASGHDRLEKEGIRALEGIVKFGAAMALASRPKGEGAIPGVQLHHLARPSLGTWMSVAQGQAAKGGDASPAAVWMLALIPERKSVSLIQELVTLRNDIAHGGHDATPEQSATLRGFLIDVAHRLASSWPWKLHVVTSLEFDGTSFDVRTKLHSGTTPPESSSFISSSAARTGDIVLVGPDGRQLPLNPWLAVVDVDGKDNVGIYDSASLPRRGSNADPALQYADPVSRQRGLTPRTGGATWSQLESQFAPKPPT